MRTGRLSLLFAMGIALVTSASLTSIASAIEAPPSNSVLDGATRRIPAPAGPDWTIYADAVPVSAKVVTIEGRKNPDGSCTISDSGSVPPGGLAVRSDEIAFNPITCQSQIARYRLSNEEAALADDAAEDTARASSSEESSGSGRNVTGGPGDAASMAVSSEGAYSRTWYEDPPGIDVTSVRNSTNWTYNGSCVLSQTGRAHYSWFTTSGWSKIGEDFEAGYNCSRSRSSSYARFRNGVFCLTIDTYNTYDRNRIFGQEDGGYNWSYDATKSGGCTALLSIHHSAAFN